MNTTVETERPPVTEFPDGVSYMQILMTICAKCRIELDAEQWKAVKQHVAEALACDHQDGDGR